jgi:hypothetical protein
VRCGRENIQITTITDQRKGFAPQKLNNNGGMSYLTAKV